MESKNLCPRLKPRSSTWTCSCDSYRALLPQVNPNCSCINYLLARIELMESYWPKLFEHVTNFFHFWTKWLFKGKNWCQLEFYCFVQLRQVTEKNGWQVFPSKVMWVPHKYDRASEIKILVLIREETLC